MEVQGQILTIRHAPHVVNENIALRKQISQLEAVVKTLTEENIELKQGILRQRGLESYEKAKETIKKKKLYRGKLQPRKNWKPPE